MENREDWLVNMLDAANTRHLNRSLAQALLERKLRPFLKSGTDTKSPLRATHGQLFKLAEMIRDNQYSSDLWDALMKDTLAEFLVQGEGYCVLFDPKVDIKELKPVYSERLRESDRWFTGLGGKPLDIDTRYDKVLSMMFEPERTRIELRMRIVELPRDMVLTEVELWHRDREEAPASLRELIAFGEQHTALLKTDGVGAVGERFSYDRIPFLYAPLGGELLCNVTDHNPSFKKGKRFLVTEL